MNPPEMKIGPPLGSKAIQCLLRQLHDMVGDTMQDKAKVGGLVLQLVVHKGQSMQHQEAASVGYGSQQLHVDPDWANRGHLLLHELVHACDRVVTGGNELDEGQTDRIAYLVEAFLIDNPLLVLQLVVTLATRWWDNDDKEDPDDPNEAPF